MDTHSIRQVPLHFPSRASPCAITFQLDSNAGYTTFRGSVKGTGYPLHSPGAPSLSLPCVTLCHHVSNGLYKSTVRPGNTDDTIISLHVVTTKVCVT